MEDSLLVRERERGTLEQLSVTPVSKEALIIGKLIPYAVIGMIQTVFVLVLMRLEVVAVLSPWWGPAIVTGTGWITWVRGRSGS